MARDQALVEVATGTGWTQLTNGDVGSGSTITFQVRSGSVEVHATINTTEPSGSEKGIIYENGYGERNVELSAIVHLSSVVRLWARALDRRDGGSGATVYVDHA